MFVCVWLFTPEQTRVVVFELVIFPVVLLHTHRHTLQSTDLFKVTVCSSRPRATQQHCLTCNAAAPLKRGPLFFFFFSFFFLFFFFFFLFFSSCSHVMHQLPCGGGGGGDSNFSQIHEGFFFFFFLQKLRGRVESWGRFQVIPPEPPWSLNRSKLRGDGLKFTADESWCFTVVYVNVRRRWGGGVWL